MAETVLVERERICKRCNKPSMESIGMPKSFWDNSGEMFKTLLKCVICGRVSTIIRPTQ